MKIISLNIWGGRVKEEFLNFLRSHQDVDIFCFQEVYYKAKGKEPETFLGNPDLDIYTELQKTLPGYAGFFRPAGSDFFGQALFVKNNVEVLEEGDTIIYDNLDPNPERGLHSRNMQWAIVKKDTKEYLVMNLHGIWTGDNIGKKDTPERIEQSKKILEFMQKFSQPKILCGDFNLLPDTKSIIMLEEGMKNLIKEFNVQSTRTKYYEKEARFADYILVSPEIEVKDFKVLPDEVSDHSPLFLEIR